jgi:hypothetical protein
MHGANIKKNVRVYKYFPKCLPKTSPHIEAVMEHASIRISAWVRSGFTLNRNYILLFSQYNSEKQET